MTSFSSIPFLVFVQIKQPGLLWETWKLSKSLDQMTIQVFVFRTERCYAFEYHQA